MKIQVSADMTSVIVRLLVALGAGLTLYGLLAMDWPAFAATRLPAALQLMELWAALAVIVAALSFWRRIHPLFAGLLVAALVSLLAGVLWPVLAVLLLGLASFTLGRLLLSSRIIAGVDATGVECLLVGVAIYGTLVGLLAHFPVNYPGVYGLLFVAPILIGWRHVRDALGRARFLASVPPATDRHLVLLQSCVAAIALVHFLVSLMPEVGHDALASHLFVPAQLAWRHEWGFDVGHYVWAVMPMLGDWVFSIGYMLAGESAARITNLGCILVLAALVREVALWAGGGEKGALWAVLLFLTTPLTFTESSSLFIESVWASLVVCGSLAVLRLASSTGKAGTNIVLAGVLLGGALAAKAVTFTVLPVLLVMLLIAFRNWMRAENTRAILVGLALCLGIGLVPYLTAWLATGNPIFPFFNEYFRSPLYPPTNFEAPGIFDKGMTWNVLYRIVFDSGKFLEASPGAAGFQWLLLIIPAMGAMLLSWHRRGLLLLVVAGAAAWLTFEQTAYLRYVFPSFALASAAAGVALGSLFSMHPRVERTGYAAAIVVVALNLLYFTSGTYYGAFDPRVVASASARAEYISTRVPIRNAVDLVNALNTQESPVAFFTPPMTAGLKADALYANWYNADFAGQVSQATTPVALGATLARSQVQFVVLDDAWGDETLRHSINEVTEEVGRFGTVSVRSLDNSYRYAEELLRNTAFDTAAGWELVEKARLIDGGVVVSVSSPAYQVVPVVVDRGYRYTATARCLDGAALGRLQVNWLDGSGKMLKPDIQVFECTPAVESHSMDIRSPAGAAAAVVYATGHTETPLVFASVSFRD